MRKIGLSHKTFANKASFNPGNEHFLMSIKELIL